MNKERAETLRIVGTSAAALGLLLFTMLGAFSEPQKKYIKERDKEFGIRTNRGGCQWPEAHPCNGDKAVQIHHIIPQRYAKEFGIDPDFIENGVTLCEYSHQNLLHEDMRQAHQDYWKDKSSFKKTFANRKEKLKNGLLYWNDAKDRILHTIVMRSEQRARKAGKPRPGEDGFIPPERHHGTSNRPTRH